MAHRVNKMPHLCPGLYKFRGIALSSLVLAANLEHVGEHRSLGEEVKDDQLREAEAERLRTQRTKGEGVGAGRSKSCKVIALR